MIVGGLAAAYHGVPRATFDIDLVVAISPDHLHSLVRTLRAQRFDLRLRQAKQLLRLSNVMPTHHRDGLRLDLWLMRSEHDREAFTRRQLVEVWSGVRAWIASPEDMILSKLVAGRAKDFEDAIGIMSVQSQCWTARLP